VLKQNNQASATASAMQTVGAMSKRTKGKKVSSLGALVL